MDAACYGLSILSFFFFILSILMNFYYKLQVTENFEYDMLIQSIKGGSVIVGYFAFSLIIYFGFQNISFIFNSVIVDPQILQKSESNQFITFERYEKYKSIEASLLFKHAFLVGYYLISTFFFVIFCGAGLAFLPYDLINCYVTRPVQMDPEDMVLGKKILQEESGYLIGIGKRANELQLDVYLNKDDPTFKLLLTQGEINKKKYEVKKRFIKFEDMHEAYQTWVSILQQNPLWYILSLVLGIGSLLLSLYIIIDVITYFFGRDILGIVFVLIEKKSLVVALSLNLLFTIYLAMSVFYGIIKLLKHFGSLIQANIIKIEDTCLDSLNSLVSFLNPCFVGLWVYLVENLQQYYRFTAIQRLFERILMKVKYVNSFQKYQLFKLIMTSVFIICLFISFFLYNGIRSLKSKISIKRKEIEKEKKRLKNLEENQLLKIQ